MDNLKLEQALVAYIEGRLDASSRKRLEELLAGDPALRKQLEYHRRVNGLLMGMKSGVVKDAQPAKPETDATKKAAKSLADAFKSADFDGQRQSIMARIAEKNANRKIPPPPDAMDIEFRLCQYMEGDLNPYRKAEIEERIAKDEWLKYQKFLYDSLQTQIELYRRPPVNVDYAAQRAKIMKAVSELASQKALQAPADKKAARILYIRPLVAAASVAAVLILSVLVWFAVRPNLHKPASSVQAYAMVIPPAVSGGKIQTTGEIVPPSWDELLTPLPASSEEPIASGTVLVSVGPAINENIQAGGVGLLWGF